MQYTFQYILPMIQINLHGQLIDINPTTLLGLSDTEITNPF